MPFFLNVSGASLFYVKTNNPYFFTITCYDLTFLFTVTNAFCPLHVERDCYVFCFHISLYLKFVINRLNLLSNLMPSLFLLPFSV